MCLELLLFFLDTGPITYMPLTYLYLMVGFTEAVLSMSLRMLDTRQWLPNLFGHRTSHLLIVPLHDVKKLVSDSGVHNWSCPPNPQLHNRRAPCNYYKVTLRPHYRDQKYYLLSEESTTNFSTLYVCRPPILWGLISAIVFNIFWVWRWRVHCFIQIQFILTYMYCKVTSTLRCS
jgi:hypothetical protein